MRWSPDRRRLPDGIETPLLVGDLDDREVGEEVLASGNSRPASIWRPTVEEGKEGTGELGHGRHGSVHRGPEVGIDAKEHDG